MFMKSFTPVFAASAVLLLSMCSPKEKNNPTPEPPAAYEYDSAGYQPFPSGYGYMEHTEMLAEAVENSDLAYVRDHAWKLWAGIWQQASGIDWPVWYTWPNTYDAFINPPSQRLGAGVSGDMARQQNTMSLIQQNRLNGSAAFNDTNFVDTNNVNIPNVPYYPIPQPVQEAYPGVIHDGNIDIGPHFMSNGDIMIPTESYSIEGYDWIVDNDLNLQSKLTALQQSGTKSLDAPQTYIVTKHMFWPVLDSNLNIIPIWNENAFPVDYPGYAGYETWKDFVAIDPSGQYPVGSTAPGTYLYGVYTDNTMKTPVGPFTAEATVVDINDFYYHQVSADDWASFSPADQASIMAASYWAYNKPFTPGDYLVTVAMHINTKEIASWALQSVWWTNNPGAGRYGANQPDLPQAKGPWKHYDLVTSYGIIDPNTGQLPVEMNPYIELVIHPIATSCRNCHIRAGWPEGNAAGTASYQNPDCNDLLAPLTPASPCLQEYMLTDFQWVIPDHATK